MVRRQAYVQVPPARLFGEDALALHGRVDHVLLVASHDRDEVTVDPMPGISVAAHMRASLEEERGPFLQAYRQFRFLFPERRSAAMDEAPATERLLLDRYLARAAAHVLRHPYPVRLESLVGPVESSSVGAEPADGRGSAEPAGIGASEAVISDSCYVP